jgi:hypothetical protein
MRRVLLAAAVTIMGLSGVPAFARDFGYEHVTRERQAAVERDRAELRRDLAAHRHGARNIREIEADRRALAHDQAELRRAYAMHGRW